MSKITNGQLYVDHRNAHEKPLEGLKKDYFWYVGGFFRFEFQRDDQGTITGFKVSGTRVWNIRFK
jgi:hypothetical protein